MDFKEVIDFVENNKKEYLEKEMKVREKTKVYVLKFGNNEYAESFDMSLREVTMTDDKYNAEHIHDKSKAVYYADRFACVFEEIEIEN